MLGDKLRYVVMCGCTGSLELIAVIDDHRPGEHPLSTLRGFVTVESPDSQDILAGLASTMAIPEEEADSRLVERNLTRTFWKDGHVTWTMRCHECGKQAQMNRDTIIRIIDDLANGVAAANVHLPLVPMPDPSEPERHMIQLGVLCTMITQLNG